jgi:CelD/BcsL family acetyltransferase involved in cellulose biosynthesis
MFPLGAMNQGALLVSKLRSIYLTSVEQLRAAASDWDDLWWRSETALPTARAEMLARWIEQFKPRAAVHMLIVAEGPRWVAALPLVSCRVGGVLAAAGMPSNPWMPCGELLLDAASDTPAALDLLLAEAAELSGQLLWLNEAVPESPRWQALLRACDRAGMATAYHERFRVGRVTIGRNWDIYQKGLPKSHRQGIVRAAKRLACEGDVHYEMHSRLDVSEVEPWLRDAFELEDCGWKGEAGTSVLRTPGMFRFFVGQAQQLARWGQLETASLRLDGRLLAFLCGFRAKGVYFAHKISYDPRLAAFSPGQLLFYHVLEQLHQSSDTWALDFMGPLNQAVSRWRPESYGIGRVAIAPRRWMGRAAMYAYKHWWRRFRQWESAATVRRHHQAPAADDDSILEPAEMSR